MIEEVFREEWPRVVASLRHRFGDLDIAEEAASEAFLAAVTSWSAPGAGPPPNPGGWLMTTATRKAIDRLRRERKRTAKYIEALMLTPDLGPDPTIADDQLRLIFTCAHPALAPETRLALTLRMVAGLTVAEIARALLTSEAAIARRITRAKTKLREAHIPFAVPQPLTDGLTGVLTVIYLIFNEGYLPGGGDDAIRVGLCEEAIRLARLLHDLLPTEPETAGLLALLLLIDSRRSARLDKDDDLVTLDRQDRLLWNRTQMAEGQALVRACVAHNRAGRFQLQAAISAVHSVAETFDATDWSALDTLYAQLQAIDPSPVVALNRAVVTAELEGAEAALAAIVNLPLQDYHALHLTRAELLRRAGRDVEARAAYTRAIELTANPAEIRHLERRRRDLGLAEQ